MVSITVLLFSDDQEMNTIAKLVLFRKCSVIQMCEINYLKTRSGFHPIAHSNSS